MGMFLGYRVEFFFRERVVGWGDGSPRGRTWPFPPRVHTIKGGEEVEVFERLAML